MTMQMRQPEGSGGGSGPGMRAKPKEPKRYIGLRYDESMVRKIRLAADSKDMSPGDYILAIIEDQVEEDIRELSRQLHESYGS